MPVEEVGLADEIGDEEVGGFVVDLAGLAALDDASAVHDADGVAHRQRLFLIVRDEHEGDAELALQVLQLDLHVGAQLLVQCRERLVEKQHGGLVDQRAGQRDALLLAAGKFMDLAAAVAGQPHHRQRVAGLAADLARRQPRPDLAQPVGDIVLDIEMREKRIVLEHHVDRPAIGRDADHVPAADQHLAFARLLEAADHAQAGRLAAAGRSKQCDKSWPAEWRDRCR